MWPMHYARYMADCYLVRRSREGLNELGDNGAHRCVDYCFCKRTAIISAAKVRAIANARIAPMPCSFAARMAANRSCFSGIFMSYPQ